MRLSSRALLSLVVAVTGAAIVAVVVIVSTDDGDADGGTAARGEWTSLRPAGLERTEVAAARLGRYVFVVGGFERRSGASTAAVERYDIKRDRWRRVRSMPVALNHPAAAAYRGAVYVLGGYTGQGDLRGEVSSLYRYDPRRDRWSRRRGAPMKRGALAVGVIGRKLYAAGGANSRDGALKTLEIYDFRRNQWTTGPPLSLAREHLAGAVADGAFYVLAGRAAGQGNFDVVERYLPAERRWEKLPAMRKPRGGFGATTVGGRVVVVGGEEASGTIREVEAFDPARRTWTDLPDMRTARHGLGVVSFRGRVYSIEGGPTPGFDFSNAIEALDVAASPP